MTQIWALRSRLEKQPTDLRRNSRDLADGTLVTSEELILVGRRRGLISYSDLFRHSDELDKGLSFHFARQIHKPIPMPSGFVE